MATEVKDQWCDPYPVERSTLNGKPVSELPVFATQVIDGKGYRIAVPPPGKEGFVIPYCIGPVKVVDEKAVILEKLEKPVSDPPLTSISHAQDIDEELKFTTPPIDSTCDVVSTPVKFTKRENPPDRNPAGAGGLTTGDDNSLYHTRKNRALRKDLPEDEILASTEPCRVLADRYGVSAQTISKIKRGQRVLILT